MGCTSSKRILIKELQRNALWIKNSGVHRTKVRKDIIKIKEQFERFLAYEPVELELINDEIYSTLNDILKRAEYSKLETEIVLPANVYKEYTKILNKFKKLKSLEIQEYIEYGDRNINE